MSVYAATATDMLDSWLTGKTLKAIVVTTNYAQDALAHQHYSDIQALSGAELSAPGYTPGGVVLTGVTTSYDSANRRQVIVCNDIDFGTLTADTNNIQGVVIYVATGTPSTSKLVSADLTPSSVFVAAGSDLTYSVDPASGFLVGSI